MYHAIVFDVDAKDLTTGLNSPPKAFIEKDFLQKVASVIIPEGILMLIFILTPQPLHIAPYVWLCA